MRTSLCAGRWMCALTLTLLMLVSAMQVESYVPIISISCCQNVSSRNLGRIQIRACYEQKPREGCRRHAFRVITQRNKEWCINPEAAWIREKMQKGKLLCLPEFLDSAPLSGRRLNTTTPS